MGHHDHPSLASSSRAVLAGLDWYIDAAREDGRQHVGFDVTQVVQLPGGDVSVRLDLVLEHDGLLAARTVLWDAPALDAAMASVSAYSFAAALAALNPGRSFSTIGIWQSRRRQQFEIGHDEALAQREAASAVLEAM